MPERYKYFFLTVSQLGGGRRAASIFIYAIVPGIFSAKIVE
jgi:hypothetical protein